MVIIYNGHMEKTYVTVLNAAELLSVSADTVRRWEKKGLIKATRSEDNYRLFKVSELKALHKKIESLDTHSNYTVLKNKKKAPYTVIELFAGTGGTALGMEHAGLKHTFFNENEKNAVATLRLNRPQWVIDDRDVRDVDFNGMTADVVQGGFPCQAFSYAGKKMGFEDARGTMFFEFARAVKEVRPKIAIAENVKGLLNHGDGKTLKSMIDVMDELGYRTMYKVVRAQYLDVPQKRERLIIISIRKDLNIPFIFPKERGYIVTLREALKNCPTSPGQEYPHQKKEILEMIPQGGYWKDLPVDTQKKYMGASYYLGGGKTGMARRLSWDEPSLTLTCSPAQKQTERCHPEETRPLTVREYARIQTFPDDWKFVGSTASQYKQIGNAVPVNLGYHIGNCVIAMLSGVYSREDFDVISH